MKNEYISAINKISASNELREKTLEKMQSAKESKKPNKALYKHVATAITACAACVALVLAIPAIMNLQGYKSAAPMEMADAGQSSPAITNDQAPQAAMFQTKEGLNEANSENGLGAAMPRLASGAEGLTQDLAEEIAFSGGAFLENADEAGGYEPEGMELLKSECIEGEGGVMYFKITVELADETKAILIVK